MPLNLEDLIEFFFPKVCLHCGLYKQEFLCEQCKSLLVQIKPESFITRLPSRNWYIKKADKHKTVFEKVYYFYEYNAVIHSLLQEIKYRNNPKCLFTAYQLLIDADEFSNIDFSIIDLITYIPMHPKKIMIRGFNQTEKLAALLSNLPQIPYLQIGEKIKDTKSQVDLNKIDRHTNLKNAFQVKNKLPVHINRQNILIIDDVCTTGSTLEELGITLKNTFPGIRIFGLVLSRGKTIHL